jgi:protein TonB
MAVGRWWALPGSLLGHLALLWWLSSAYPEPQGSGGEGSGVVHLALSLEGGVATAAAEPPPTPAEPPPPEIPAPEPPLPGPPAPEQPAEEGGPEPADPQPNAQQGAELPVVTGKAASDRPAAVELAPPSAEVQVNRPEPAPVLSQSVREAEERPPAAEPIQEAMVEPPPPAPRPPTPAEVEPAEAPDDAMAPSRSPNDRAAAESTASAAGSGGAAASEGSPGVDPGYLAVLRAWLARYKEYPRQARMRRQEGTALLRFVLDRRGAVLEFAIERSSGVEALDRAVLNMLARAQPLPPLPADLPADRLELELPVAFDLD